MPSFSSNLSTSSKTVSAMAMTVILSWVWISLCCLSIAAISYTTRAIGCTTSGLKGVCNLTLCAHFVWHLKSITLVRECCSRKISCATLGSDNLESPHVKICCLSPTPSTLLILFRNLSCSSFFWITSHAIVVMVNLWRFWYSSWKWPLCGW